MTKPRILIIENSVDVTGALKSITRTAYDLKNEFDFQFVIPKDAKCRFWIEAKGFNVIYELPMRELSRRPYSILTYWPILLINSLRLKRIVKKGGISLIHVNDLYNLLPVILKFVGLKIPYICHIRFMPDRFPKSLFRFWLMLHFRFAGQIIAVSQSVLKQLPTHNKLLLIHNELPVEERHPQLLKRSKKPIFLYLSNFIMGKGHDFALEAFAIMSKKFPEWRMRFVGGDMGLRKNKDFRQNLISRAKTLDIFDKIEWKGFTEDVELEYKEADIVLNFSESESFSITCLEALFFGRPLIATDCGGPSEIIINAQTGVLVANRDIKGMSFAMERLAGDLDMRLRMGELARVDVRERFSLENTSLKLQSVYNTILKKL